VHDDLAAGHAARRPRPCAAESIAGTPADVQRAPAHPDRSIGTDAAAHLDAAARHLHAGAVSGIAVDDNGAASHLRTDAVHVRHGAGDVDRRRATASHLEQIPELRPHAALPHREPGDRLFRQRGQPVAGEAFDLEPLAHACLRQQRHSIAHAAAPAMT
jgi:hypothetical protein